MPQINQLAENWYLASQLFWLALIFGAVFVVIGLGMYPKIEATVDARDRKVADDLASAKAENAAENGRSSCRDRGCQYVKITGVAVSLKQKTSNRPRVQIQ